MSNRKQELLAALRSAPYAYHSSVDIERLISQMESNPFSVHSVVDALADDAGTHEWAGNCIKAEQIRKLGRRLLAESFVFHVA